MSRIQWAHSAVVLVALVLTGCQGPGYSPYSGGYSSPYGGYGQPYMQPYGQPIQTMTPGPSYVPGGAYPPGSTVPGGYAPGGYAPAGASPGLQPSPDGTFRPGPTSGLSPVPEPTSSAPAYNPPPDMGGDRSVPLPRDSVNFQPPVQLDPLGGAPFRPIAPVTPVAGAEGLQPVSGAGTSPWARETNPAFQPAMGDNGEPIKANKPIVPIGEGTAPFAYDAKSYRWLRGIVSYEKRDGHWSLVYSDSPDETDELSGCVTIADQAQLRGVNDGEIILVTGELSPTDTDPRGKPIFVVRELTRHGKAEFASPELR